MIAPTSWLALQTFGRCFQVLCVRRFSTEEQAIAEANDSPFGLGSLPPC